MASHGSPLFGQSVSPQPQHIPWHPPQFPCPVPPPLAISYERNNVIPTLPMYKMKVSTKTISVPSSCVGIIIGRSGETIRDLQQRSGAHIKVTPDREASSDAAERLIYISGYPPSLEVAHSLLNDVINECLNRSSRGEVEPRFGENMEEGAKEENAFESSERQESTHNSEEKETGESDGKEEHNDSTVSLSNVQRYDPIIGNTTEKPGFSTSEEHRSIDKEKEDETNVKDESRGSPSSANDSQEGNTTSRETGQEWDTNQSSEGNADSIDAPPNAFTGQGRFVVRPKTDYPSTSISFEMKIPHAKVGVIIGRGGATIRLLQQRSGARIVVSKKMHTSRDDNLRAVTITGPQANVDTARRLIVAKINPPNDQSNGDDEDEGIDPFEFENFLVDESAVDSLAGDLSNQSLTSHLTTHVPGSPPAVPRSRRPHTPSFSGFQRPMAYVGNQPGQYGPVPPYTTMLRTGQGEFRTMDSPIQQTAQYASHFLGPPHYADRGQMPLSFPYEQVAESAEGMQGVYGDFRPVSQFFPQAGGTGVGEVMYPSHADMSSTTDASFIVSPELEYAQNETFERPE